MDSREVSKLCILLLSIFSPVILSLAVDHHGESTFENQVTSSLRTSWSKIRSIVRTAQIKFKLPNLDFRSQEDSITGGDGENGSSSAKNKMKERMKMAVEKSMEEGEAALEETAQSAAKMMGEAMHKAKDKVEKIRTEEHAGSEL